MKSTDRLPHAASTPLPELAAFLAPFHAAFARSEGRHLLAFVCSTIYVLKQKLAQMPSLSHSDALTIQSNLWN